MSLLLFGSSPPATITASGAVTQAKLVVRATATTPAHGILQQVIPAYPYQQYADDENIVAFFTAFNTLAQGYLTWFNTTALAVYTLPTVNGQLLDFIGQGLYGVRRPIFASSSTHYTAGTNSAPLNAMALDGKQYQQSGTAITASDDYYKRVLTWQTFIGPSGRYTTTMLLRWKIARFLYGVNGADVSLTQAQSVHIAAGPLPPPIAPVLAYTPGGSFPERTYGVRQSYVTPKGEGLAGAAASITVPANNLLVIESAPAQNGATGYNTYVNLLASNPGTYIAGTNAAALNTQATDGTNKTPVSPPTRQNSTPIPIGSSWVEPAGGLVVGASLPVTDASNPPSNYIVTVPAGVAATFFAQAVAQGILAFPFQLSVSVIQQ